MLVSQKTLGAWVGIGLGTTTTLTAKMRQRWMKVLQGVRQLELSLPHMRQLTVAEVAARKTTTHARAAR